LVVRRLNVKIETINLGVENGTLVKRARASPVWVVRTKSIVKEGGKVGGCGVVCNFVVGRVESRVAVHSSDTENDLDTLGSAVRNILLKAHAMAQELCGQASYRVRI
jgi:hypothetical protein